MNLATQLGHNYDSTNNIRPKTRIYQGVHHQKNKLLYTIINRKKNKKQKRRRQKTRKQPTIRDYYTEKDPITNTSMDEAVTLPKTRELPTPIAPQLDSSFGHKIIKNIDEDIFRFLHNNINGISASCDEFLEELTVLQEYNVSLATLAETNTNWHMPGAYNKVKTKLSKVWKKNKLVTSHTKERTNTNYQPGGTATLLTDKAIFRAHDSGKDKWGLWSYITLRGQNGRKVDATMACYEKRGI
jgi:hypothetical protein